MFVPGCINLNHASFLKRVFDIIFYPFAKQDVSLHLLDILIKLSDKSIIRHVYTYLLDVP